MRVLWLIHPLEGCIVLPPSPPCPNASQEWMKSTHHQLPRQNKCGRNESHKKECGKGGGKTGMREETTKENWNSIPLIFQTCFFLFFQRGRGSLTAVLRIYLRKSRNTRAG